MMRRLWLFLTDSRHLAILGLAAMAGLYYLGAELMELALVWVVAATCATVLLWLAARWLRRRLAARRTAQLERAIAETAAPPAGAEDRDVDVLRTGLLRAIDTLRSSKLGITTGSRALYELPWYMIIGNPAAGKSSAVVHSGLQFPIADSQVVQGVGGTRHCDWFFTTEGIVLDTAGRYAVDDEHRAEWHGFLDLLKKHRARAPVNGIVIAVSIAELRGADADAGIRLARSLRKRVQDLIERLAVFAPVYVVFTKADLIAGFAEFFAPFERAERERPWGATMPYQRKAGTQEILAFFDGAFDELHEGLKETCIANMSLQRRDRRPSGIFTFPLEFSSLRVPLRAFLATLFEENAFQFKPLFRGFYFTSALQEGAPQSAHAHRVAERFALSRRTVPAARPEAGHETGYNAGHNADHNADHETGHGTRPATGQAGYFLLGLFRSVIFEDRNLVSQYASRSNVRFKYAAFVAVAVALGIALAGWSWSYLGNRQLLATVQGDLDKVVRLQDGRLDLQSRLEALDVLQQRIGQLETYRRERPWALSLGLYQGELLERKLREEYFAGVREVLLKPVAASLEALLYEMNANAGQLVAPAVAQQPAQPAAQGTARAYADASPTSVEDAYNALKTYLMLSDPSRAEPGHLNDQLTRFWRGWLEANRGAMPREQMIRSAERLLTFHLAQVGDPSWPRIEQKLALVDTARDNLRRVVRGMPARDRVYAEIRARAATRFPALTVGRIVGEQDAALVQGSHAVSGTFTREAWNQYVAGAIRDVAAKELQSTDWVLQTASRDDLTLEGSPEQIEKNLVDMYKADYTREWQKFVQGIAIADMNGFNGAVAAMNRLGDPQASPIARLLNTIHEQTAWDGPMAPGAQVQAAAQAGIGNWLRTHVLQRAPSAAGAGVTVNLPAGAGAIDRAAGPVARAFAPVARIVGKHDRDASLLRSYLDMLSRLRTRLNGLQNQGDPGPGAKAFMQQTLEGSGSELADALRFVDEQMLNGISATQKAAVRPLLVRPLMQTFAVIVGPAEVEINKTWLAQVYEPFNRTLAGKYPFAQSARIEASQAEIAQFFGPDGLVAKFVNTSMGPLVVRRGDVLAPRTWADMGITLQAQAVQRFPGWVAAAGTGPSAATAQTVFQLLPIASPGTIEYTVEIDGQQLRYRNTPPQWTSMVHPGAQGVPGARVSAVAFDGRNVELFNEAGQFGLKRLIDAATKKRKDGGVHELRWSADGLTVAVDLRITSSPAVTDDAATPQQGFTGMRLPETIVGGAPAAAPVSPPAMAPVPAPAAVPVVAQAMAPAMAGGAR